MLWELFQQNRIAQSNWKAETANLTAREAKSDAQILQRQVASLERQCERLTLAAIAMAEILRDKLGVLQSDIEARILEIDARDGQTDGRFRPLPAPCPECQQLNGVGRTECLYCGAILGNGSFLFPSGDADKSAP